MKNLLNNTGIIGVYAHFKANPALKNVKWNMKADAIARWNPAIRSNDDRKTNVIAIDGTIGESYWEEGFTSKTCAAALKTMKGDIVVTINSPGGDFFDGVAIYNELKLYDGHVTVKIIGLAASAASLIAMAGDRIEIAETGFLMIHNAWSIVLGNRHDLRDSADTMERFDETMAKLYAKVSGEDESVTAKWMDEETFFTGPEAIENGFAHAYLPSDYIEEDEDAKAMAGETRAAIICDTALRAHNPDMSRKERRALLSSMKSSTPRATESVKLGADDTLAQLRLLTETIKA
ncbi:MAG: peptidase [Robiginitomaculum sp.]|nr:MAG: peptidase [Robiginitomaculum sp.]